MYKHAETSTNYRR